MNALHVAPLEAGRFRVTGGAAAHVVALDRDLARCDCKDYAYRRHACKHLRAALEYIVHARRVP